MLVFVVLIANLVQGWEKPELNLKGSRTIMATMTAIIYFIYLLKNIKEKKGRFFRLLSVKENLSMIFDSPIGAIAFFVFGIFLLKASIISYDQQKNIWNSCETYY